MEFKEKAVIVTGAGAGIGRMTAIRFAELGARVAINSVTPKNGEETLRLVRETGADGIYIRGDVSNAAEAETIVAQTIKAFGRVDIVVNNAGLVLPGAVDTISEEDWDRTMAVNLKGIYQVSRFAIAVMKRQGGGVIVNVASVSGIKASKDRAAYCASKGGVIALTKAMALDYIDDNIRVNCVCPGTVDTPSLNRRIEAFADPEKARREFRAKQPVGRLGSDSEIAYAILFAACDEVSFMDGSAIVVDGGMTI